jgi:ABC-type polysaccharide/polyol phosphate export permease
MARQPLYDSANRRSALLGEVVELVRNWDLLQLLVSKINKTRYKRSSLGALWTLLNPLLNMTVLTIAFSQLFRFDLPHYPIYVLAGLIHWQFFQQVTTYAMSTLVWGGDLIKRIYVPRTIFAVAAIGNGVVNLLLATGVLLVIMIITGHPVYPTWWVVPFAILLLAMFALGVALFMCTLAMYFTDVVEMYGVAVQVWFFMTPVIYPKEALPAKYVWYLNLNPVHSLLELFRTPIYRGYLPGINTVVAAVCSAVFSLLIGWWVFTRRADDLAYRV